VAVATGLRSKELYPRVFGRHAAEYKERLDEVMARGEARGRLRMIELAGIRPGMSVLDLACGPGTISRRVARLAQPGGRVVGVDLAREMLELAALDRTPSSCFAVMDIERLAFGAAAFDVVVCGHGLQFAPHLDVALGEARRVLRQRGVLAASVPAPGREDSVWRLIDRVVDGHLPPAPRAVDDVTTRTTVQDPAAFRDAALAAGFAAAQVEVVDEEVVWDSAEVLVARFASWWQCASRMDSLEADKRRRFVAEATEAVRREHPGAITTHGRNVVLRAQVA
jgi:ubiquinone/menaquinone biosynthesis C-methylase UbiE